MWIATVLAAAVLGAAGSANAPAGEVPSPSSPQWTLYYVNGKDDLALNFYYDKAIVLRRGDKIATVIDVRGAFHTMQTVEIDCAKGLFSEIATRIFEDSDYVRTVPESELLVDRPISPGDPADKLRQVLCATG